MFVEKEVKQRSSTGNFRFWCQPNLSMNKKKWMQLWETASSVRICIKLLNPDTYDQSAFYGTTGPALAAIGHPGF